MFPYIKIFSNEIGVYDVFSCLWALTMLVYNLAHIREKRAILGGLSLELLQKNRGRRTKLAEESFYIWIEILLVTVIVVGAGTCVNSLWARICTRNRANYFGNIYFLPFLAVLAFRFLRIPPLKQLDSCTPGIALALVAAKLGCFCAGCCYGFAMEGSFYYNYDREEYQFPIQLLEAGVALAIFFVLRVYKKRNRYPGSVYPMFMILYSATRFCTEFLRADFAPLVWRMNIYHFQCLAGLLLGLAEFFLLRKYTASVSAWEDRLQIPRKSIKK